MSENIISEIQGKVTSMLIKSTISDFEKLNEYVLPDELKTSLVVNDLIHLNQLNDIKNEEFNHICFIGKYSKLLRNQEKYEFLKNKNIVFRDLKNQIFLTKDLNKDEFKPVHTPYSFSCKVVSSFDDVYNGFIIHEQYYILLNTDDNELKYNVYIINKNICKETNADYLFFVLIGKIVSPVSYSLEELCSFEQKYNLKLNEQIKEFMSTQAKILTLNIDGKQKIFHLNLNGNPELYTHLSKPFSNKGESYDLEQFRKPLLKLWQRNIIGENVDDEVQVLRAIIADSEEQFLDGFMKIGTLENENFKNYGIVKREHNLIVEVYMLLNSENDQGSIWIYHVNEPGNANFSDINYLPIKRMFKIGSIFTN
jgi:hypothetical protein